jgi:septum site-determining protein MinC
MTVATAGKSTGTLPASFELKSTQLPLLALILKTRDIALLAQDLAARFGSDGESPNFFDHDGVVLDFSGLPDGEPCQLPELMALLRQYSLAPVAVRAAPAELAQAALAAGLVLAAPDVRVVGKPTEVEVEQTPVAAAPATIASAAAPAPPSTPTLVVDKPLRSGQRVYARGGDLVVLAMVNPGAEVVADGSIHVYAPLRGKAIAGARGNTQARIFSLCLEPELVSIAGTYRTSETPLPATVLGKPAQVRLAGDDNDKLVFEPLKA